MKAKEIRSKKLNIKINIAIILVKALKIFGNLLYLKLFDFHLYYS